MKIHREDLLDDFYKHEKINVAILTDIYLPYIGGAGIVTDKLANSLNKNKETNVVLITGNVKNYKDMVDYPVIRCKSMPIPKAWGDSLPLPNFDKKLTKMLKNLKIDIIHIHSMFGLCSYGLKFAKKYNIPVIMHCHSKFSEEFPTIIKFKPLCNLIVKRNYKTIDKGNLIIAVSNNTKENLLSHNIKSPIEVLPNATDLTECLDKDKAIKYIEDKHGIKQNEENILMCACRINIECKNLLFLLNSLKILKERKIPFKFLMIGSGPDDHKFKEIVNNYNLDKNVIIVGNIKDREILKYYYLRSDLFLFPSTVDNCPLVKSEAASQKTPTIALNNTGSSEGIIDFVNGYLSEHSEQEYANKIEIALSNKQELQKISETAQKTLAKTWDDNAKKCIEYYKNLLKNKKSA